MFSQGGRLVSGSFDKTIRIWNHATTDEVEGELQGHTASVWFVAFSRDGSRLVSVSADNTILIWNTATGDVETKLGDPTHSVRSVAFSSDGSRLVSGSLDQTVRIWNTTTGALQAEPKGHTKSVTSIAFSEDGTRIISGSADRTVRIWNATTGQEELCLIGHMNMVSSVAFSRDGTQVVSSASDDYTVRIWDATIGNKSEATGNESEATGNESESEAKPREAKARLKGHTQSVKSVAFSQDGSTVVSASDDKTVRIWNVAAGSSQLMSSCDMNHTLPNGSVVYRTGIWGFHIIYPGQLPTPTTYPALTMSGDQQWIVGPFHDRWIPIHYRNFLSSAFWGNKVCLGYKSGRIVILDMTSTVVE